MSHPWVYSVTRTGSDITLSVEVTDLHKSGQAIEITGVATQHNGAFAPIYSIVEVTSATAGDPNDPEVADRYFVPVPATPAAEHPFVNSDDVTAFARVSIPWVTVLGPGSDEPGGPTWGNRKADGHIGTVITPDSHPWVYSATRTGNNITLSVEVTNLRASQQAIEITGEATQLNGAFAPIYSIVDVTSATEGDPNDPEVAGKYFVSVPATPTAEHPFVDSDDVTAFARVAMEWVTVLGPGTDGQSTPATEPGGPTWGNRKADGHIAAAKTA